jgi:hypothetical protein
VTYRHDDGSESKARDLTVAPSSHYLNWDLDRLVNNTGKMGNYGKDGMRSFSNKTYYLNEYLLANSTYRGFCMDAVTVCVTTSSMDQMGQYKKPSWT